MLSLCDKSKDFIDMIHVRKLSISTEHVEEKANELLEQEEFKNSTFTTLEYDHDKGREFIILDHVHEESTPYIDFFVVANQGTGVGKHKSTRYMGHVSTGIINNSKTNVMVVL